MDKVWAPWRMQYISSFASARTENCFLCIDKKDDEAALVVGRNDRAFVVMNRFPYTNGHVMVVPVRHVGSIELLTDEELLDMMKLVQIMTGIFKEVFRIDGLNMGCNMGRAAGAGLEEHIHLHMVPRWFGDTNFMPVLGETKIISEHITETFNKLKSKFIEKLL